MTSIADIWLKLETKIYEIPIVTNITLFLCTCFINIISFKYVNSIKV